MCQELQKKYGESPVALWRRPTLVAAEALAREKRVLASQVKQLMRDCLIGDELESVDSMSLEELECKRVQLEERKAAKALEMQKEEDARAKAAVEKRAKEKLAKDVEAREEAAKQRKAKEEARKARQQKEKREAHYRARLAAAGWELHHDEHGTP